jgi:P-type conjugative transfer ATPase TrbB
MPLTGSESRLFEKLYNDLGDDVIQWLSDPDITEIMLNPDGRLWVDSNTRGNYHVSHLSCDQALSIIFSVAGIHDVVINRNNPRLEESLPVFKAMQGERFTAQIPPIVPSPHFSIRKKAIRVLTLNDYVDSGRSTQEHAGLLKTLVARRKNILICGGPGSGKSTVMSALISEAVLLAPDQRFLLLEDTPELQCLAKNQVPMRTTHAITLTELVRSAMRLSPDRILIGEVRGAEALDVLKAWNTGCPGGFATVHANGAEEAMQRMLDLSMEAGLTVPPHSLLHHTVDAIVNVVVSGTEKGFIQDIYLTERGKS